MKRLAYYNEHDPFAAAWLRALIADGHLAPGDVDERSITDVRAKDVASYCQCHFFAGIGIWSYALRRAGWPDDRPVWTGSCPCQPFSTAGKGLGTADDRHLWPVFARLIGECRPSIVFGEQVASAAGRTWLDAVCADLEALDYACGAADLCAAGVGAPHIRQRLYWVADTARERRIGLGLLLRPEEARRDTCDFLEAAGGGVIGGMADTPSRGTATAEQPRRLHGTEQSGANISRWDDGGRWSDALNDDGGMVDWLYCMDGKWRPVEPGTFPLAHGNPGSVGRLRGYGNALHADVAEAFITAYCETRKVIAP